MVEVEVEQAVSGVAAQKVEEEGPIVMEVVQVMERPSY